MLYDILFRSVNNTWLIIFKEDEDQYWKVFHEDIRDYVVARQILDGLKLLAEKNKTL